MKKQIIITIDDKAGLPFTEIDVNLMKLMFSEWLESKYYLEVKEVSIKTVSE